MKNGREALKNQWFLRIGQTNPNFNEWDGVFYDAVVANAIMDRILHHAHVVPISGKSYRLKDHLRQTD